MRTFRSEGSHGRGSAGRIAGAGASRRSSSPASPPASPPFLLAPLVLVSLAACAAAAGPGQPSAWTGSPGSAGPVLAASDWIVETMGATALVSGREPRIAFDAEGQVAGHTGCNRFFGGYAAGPGGTLRFTGVGTTRMACMDAALAAQESTFTSILQGEATSTLNPDGTLTVRGANGIAFTARRDGDGGVATDPGVLSRGEWRVQGLGRGGVIDRSNLTLLLTADGRVSGDSGCNRFSGGYSVSGSTLTFTPLASTLRACIGDAMAEQERRYLDALTGEVRWRILPDGALELTGAEGRRILLRRDG